MPVNFENSAVVTGLEKVSLIPISRRENAKEYSNYHTIALISHTSNGEGDGTPLQYSCLENPMDRGAWWATVHGVSKSQT